MTEDSKPKPRAGLGKRLGKVLLGLAALALLFCVGFYALAYAVFSSFSERLDESHQRLNDGLAGDAPDGGQ